MHAMLAYQKLIDLFVDASKNTNASVLNHSAKYESFEHMTVLEMKARRDAILKNVSKEEKEFLNFCEHQQRVDALHDVLARFDELICLEDFTIRWNGEQVDESPFASWHFDFVCREAGDEWPTNEKIG